MRSTFSLLVGWLVGLGHKFLDCGSQPSLNGSPRNLHTSLMWNQALKSFEQNLPTPKQLAGKPQISPTIRRPAVSRKHITSKRLNMSTNTFHLQ